MNIANTILSDVERRFLYEAEYRKLSHPLDHDPFFDGRRLNPNAYRPGQGPGPDLANNEYVNAGPRQRRPRRQNKNPDAADLQSRQNFVLIIFVYCLTSGISTYVMSCSFRLPPYSVFTISPIVQHNSYFHCGDSSCNCHFVLEILIGAMAWNRNSTQGTRTSNSNYKDWIKFTTLKLTTVSCSIRPVHLYNIYRKMICYSVQL